MTDTKTTDVLERLTHVLSWLYTQDGNYDTKTEWREALVGHLYFLAGLKDEHCEGEDEDLT